MEELITNRNVLQWVTFSASMISVFMLVLMVYKNIIPWRYVFLPVSILIQIILFYAYVLVASPAPTASVTFVSGVIRFESVMGFLIVLLSVYLNHD